MILILDATQSTRVKAWLVEEGVVLAQTETKQTRKSSGFFLASVEKLLTSAKRKQSHLKGVYIAEGAGTFTTVRIAAVVGNTLAYGLDVPVAGGYFLKTFIKKDLKGVEQVLARRKGYKDSYSPQYNNTPNITKPKLVC